MSGRRFLIILCLGIASTGAAKDLADLEARVRKLEKALTEELTNETGDHSRFTDIPAIANGRLTLTSGTAVTTSDVTGAGSIFYTNYGGGHVSLYNGTNWTLHPFTEVSLALSVTVDLNYDVFLYNNNGTLTLELSSAWNADGVTRINALALQNGIYVKSGTPTRRYLGTIRASASNATEDSQSKRFVWNVNNRVARTLYRSESTANWSYATTSWRSLNNSTANRVSIVVGLAESLINMYAKNVISSANSGFVGIGEDSTNTPVSSGDGTHTYGYIPTGFFHVTAQLQKIPAIGYHYYQVLEQTLGGAATYYGGTDAKLIGQIYG